jgi:hypothetical protein
MSQRDLTVNIDGDPSGFDRAADDVVVRSLAMERQIAKLERQMATYEAQVKKTSATQEKQAATADRATKQMQGGLISLVAAGGLAGAAVTGAGVAFTIFAAVAAPAIKQVLDAQLTLDKSWETLNGRQKTTSVLVQQLLGDYQKLSKSYEPQTLSTFNGLISTTRGLLPQLNTVLGKSAVGVQDFVGQIEGFVSGPDMARFLTWSGNTAPAALHTLGVTATQTGTLATTLVEQVAPLGLTFLQAANGGLGLVNALAKSNPALAQLAITGLAVRAPITGAVASLGNLGERLSKAGGAAGGLSKAGRVLNSVTGAAPGLYVAAGTALAFFALKAFSAKTSTDKLVDSLVISSHAVGNNVAGYRQLAQELTQQLNKSLAATNAAQVQVGGSGGKLAGSNAAAGKAAVVHAQQQQVLRAKLSDTAVAIKNITSGAQQLGQRMNITSGQAIELADAAG